MRWFIRRSSRDEAGVYLVLFSVLVIVILGMVAIVIDLSALRQDRNANITNADFASTAAGLNLKGASGSAAVACETAWSYFLTNADDALPVLAPPPCASTFSGTCANPSAATATSPAVTGTTRRTAEGRAGKYTVRISNPVPSTDPLMTSSAIGRPTQAASAADDGVPCDRIAVEILLDRDPFFAGALDFGSSTTRSHSVALATAEGQDGEAVALLILEKETCNALVASGQAQVVVKYHNGHENNDPLKPPIVDPDTGLPIGPYPGRINVDSSATSADPGSLGCQPNNRRALDAQGNQNSKIIAENVPSGAPAAIRMWALAPGQGTLRAYETTQVTSGRVSPQPTPATAPTTRAPVDHQYNCKKDGHDGFANNSDDCADYSTEPPHISNLLTSVGNSGPPDLTWNKYPRDLFPTDSCNTQPSDPAVIMTGNVWVNCPTGFTVNNSVSFLGGNVVFDGGLNVQGSFIMNAGVGVQDRYAVLRTGNLSKGAAGTIVLNRVMVLLKNGKLDVGGGSGALTWIAPLGGNFEDLAMWSESLSGHDLGGQASLNVEGVFFAPNANPFKFTGQGGQVQAAAQFITRRLEVGGQGVLNMTPDPTRVVIIPALGVALIR